MSRHGRYPVEFSARNMPVTLERKGSGALFTNPGWTRLLEHIARHEKAGGWVSIRYHTPPLQPVEVEGFKCVKFADVDLLHPLA